MLHRSLAAVVLGLIAMPLHAQEVINACANPNRNNFIRLVADTSECFPIETPLTWNVEGPEGPEGPPGPPGPPGAAAVQYQFVGFSTATVNGGVGLLGMHGACQEDHGPEARMASSKEIIEEPQLSPQPGEAWVRPTFVETGNTTADLSGMNLPDPAQFTCSGWERGDNASNALICAGINFHFDFSKCDVLNHVACSVPASP